MKAYLIAFAFLLNLTWNALPVEAQTLERKPLTWEQKVISLDAVLEENGPVSATFYGVNLHQDSIWITEVITDCGCTAVGYSRDTIYTDKIASLEVVFDPDHRGGEFTKAIIVKTNVDTEGDTLFIEGINIPFPENPELQFPHRQGILGFKLPAIHMGNVFTNTPKTKFIEVYNFGSDTVSLAELQPELPDYVDIQLVSDVLVPQTRGILEISYHGEGKGDLGFFDELVSFKLDDSDSRVELRLMTVIFEYFDPVPKSMERVVPRLGISENEIDLKEINANRTVSRKITLENLGQEDLHIRKVNSNCSCVVVSLSDDIIQGGSRGNLLVEFDPKGRRGIDHKHITLFTNDPLQPVKTIVIKSNIK